jgi:hypothetical protein
VTAAAKGLALAQLVLAWWVIACSVLCLAQLGMRLPSARLLWCSHGNKRTYILVVLFAGWQLLQRVARHS